jgi:hypothetical protein
MRSVFECVGMCEIGARLERGGRGRVGVRASRTAGVTHDHVLPLMLMEGL